jgi:ABC-type nitrate/sulfonate/bicarbonate transport system substrate-binding protein
VAAQHPEIVERLRKAFDEMDAQPREHPVQSATRLKPAPGK